MPTPIGCMRAAGLRTRSWILVDRVCSSVGQSTRLISVGSLVQVQPDPPIWGRSSAGRAPALQAGGHRFDPVRLHQSLWCTSRALSVEGEPLRAERSTLCCLSVDRLRSLTIRKKSRRRLFPGSNGGQATWVRIVSSACVPFRGGMRQPPVACSPGQKRAWCSAL